MSNRLSLHTLVFLGGAALMLVPALIAGSLYTGALQRRAESLQIEKLTSRGASTSTTSARSGGTSISSAGSTGAIPGSA